MRQVTVTTLDGPAAVSVLDVDEPAAPGPGHVLVDVHAAGVCFPDTLLTRGLYQLKPDPPFALGSEIAGVVRAAPEGSRFAVGDRVAGFPVFGAFADSVVVPEALTFALPEQVSFTKGAALPMNYLTAHFALARRGRLAAGETVLVHGAAGGVGTASIQVARALGARVVAVASTPEKEAFAREAGAHETVPAEGFKDAVKELTGGQGVDVVVDPVGGERFTDSLRSLGAEGRLLVIGFTAGSIPEVKVNRLLLNNVDVVGVGWGAFWSGAGGIGYVAQQWAELAPFLADGTIDPPVGATYPLEDAAAALTEIEERRALGKVVLTVRD